MEKAIVDGDPAAGEALRERAVIEGGSGLVARRVEGEEGCRNADRLGPYPSEAAAARALETVQERNEEWDNDPAWNDELED